MERGVSLDVAVSVLSKRLKAEDLRQYRVKYAVRAIRVAAIFVVAAVTILVAAAEALPEIVVVVVLSQIVTAIPVVRVLISIGVLVIGAPVILPICFTGMETFLVTVVYGLPEHACAIKPILRATHFR
jgi:hypothetical protein